MQAWTWRMLESNSVLFWQPYDMDDPGGYKMCLHLDNTQIFMSCMQGHLDTHVFWLHIALVDV